MRSRPGLGPTGSRFGPATSLTCLSPRASSKSELHDAASGQLLGTPSFGLRADFADPVVDHSENSRCPPNVPNASPHNMALRARVHQLVVVVRHVQELIGQGICHLARRSLRRVGAKCKASWVRKRWHTKYAPPFDHIARSPSRDSASPTGSTHNGQRCVNTETLILNDSVQVQCISCRARALQGPRLRMLRIEEGGCVSHTDPLGLTPEAH